MLKNDCGERLGIANVTPRESRVRCAAYDGVRQLQGFDCKDGRCRRCEGQFGRVARCGRIRLRRLQMSRQRQLHAFAELDGTGRRFAAHPGVATLSTDRKFGPIIAGPLDVLSVSIDKYIFGKTCCQSRQVDLTLSHRKVRSVWV